MDLLIVEDDHRVADFLERGLRAEGYRVQLARTGPEGLALAREQAQRLGEGGQGVVLLDVMLPGMSGTEVCQTLRALGVQTPILMLTALGTVEDRVGGLAAARWRCRARPRSPWTTWCWTATRCVLPAAVCLCS